MIQSTQDQVASTANALLLVGDVVLAVARDHTLLNRYLRAGSSHNFLEQLEIGKKLPAFSSEKVIADCVALIEDTFIQGCEHNFEYTEHTKDEGSRDYSVRVIPDLERPNEVLYIIAKIITGRAEHIDSEDKWKIALDASGDGMWDANVENNTIYFSSKWHDIFGYSQEEVTSLSDWAALIHPDDVPAAEQSVEDLVAGRINNYSAEVRYRCKDGSYKWILSRGVILTRTPDGKPLRFIGTHKDINERKIAEDELRTTKDTFSNSFNNSGIGKALLGPGGTWIAVNDIICQLTEYSREELTKLHYRDITFPEDVDIDMPFIAQLLSREIESYTIEKRYVSKSRKIIITLLTVTLVWETPTAPKYFICDIVDITQKRDLSNELNRKNQELEATSVSLKAKVSQVEELHHIIAHNMRGPLNNIKAITEMAGMFAQDEAFKMINESVGILLEGVETLLEVSKIQLTKDVQVEACNVEKIARMILTQLQGDIYHKNVQISFALEFPVVEYPRIYLESILYNLLSNAVKYTRPGVRPLIVVSTREVKNRLQLSVKDNGLGIDMAKFGGKIFKLSQVFHSGFDSKGVGLFITKTQVESLGGTIDLKTTVDEGSEFIITM